MGQQLRKPTWEAGLGGWVRRSNLSPCLIVKRERKKETEKEKEGRKD